MTLGNKIQECRKALGLSQEELGQKLLVSRQTVSLWEKDQTLPSIDNLTRLKEIFGISVDELLGVETAVPADHSSVDADEAPLEEYNFEYSEQEYKEAYKAYTQYNRLIYNPLFMFILMIVGFALGASGWQVYFLVACFAVSVVSVFIKLYKNKKHSNVFVSDSLKFSRVIRVYNEYLEARLYIDGKFDSLNKFLFCDLSNAKDTGNLITALYRNRMLIFRKTDLKDDSLIYTKLNIKDCAPKKCKLKLYSLLLFIFTLLSVLVSAVCATKLPDIFGFDTTPYWIFFLFLPIPVFSVCFGFSTKRTVGRYTKNIVAGIIVFVILLAFGLYFFVFNTSNSFDYKCAQRIKEYTGIAIPEYKGASQRSYGDGGLQFEGGIFYHETIFEFYGDDSNKFEETLVHDSRWVKKIPYELEEWIISDDEFAYNYFLMCNRDTGEINTLPEKSGYYDLIVIYYNVQSDKMLVYEYKIEYDANK